MIERERKANARALHDGKTRRVDGRELVQVRAPEVFQRLVEIAQLAGKDPHRAGSVDRLPPRQRHVAVGIALQEGERFDYDGNGRVKSGASPMQDFPLLASLPVKRVTRKGEGDPGSAVDEGGFAVPHQGSSWTVSCSIDGRRGSPFHIATGPAAEIGRASCRE